MAAASSETYVCEVLDPFEILIAQIIQELTSVDVKIVKTVIYDRIHSRELEKIDVNTACSGATLIALLRKYRLLSRNNLGLLKDILYVLKCEVLLTKAQDFENSEKAVFDATEEQVKMIRKAGTFVDLYLVISCKKENLSDGKIRELKDAIEQGALKSLANPSDHFSTPDQRSVPVVYLYSIENESDLDTTVVIFQFPKDQKEKVITDKLQKCALEKDQWLIDNGVVQLKVNGQSSINLKESLEFKMKDELEDNVYLARKPELQYHTKNVVDIILVVEMPHSVIPHACKEVMNMCQSAVTDLLKTSDFDVNLSIIQYGNHTDSTSKHVHVVQGFCKEFDVKSKLKSFGQCGAMNGGNSGMADALSEVVKLAKSSSARPEASKLCILITFPTKTKELVHYKSHSGNDVFEVTNDLTKCQIPLYIIGADDKATKTDPITFETEELFLSGIAHIGGGRYFRISNESLLSYQNKIIGDVVKHDMSIENEEETVGELVKDALNRHFGDTNENQLAEDVLGNPRFNSSMFVQLLQNGRSLEPIDQVAKRIALSDDLDDAIETLEGIKKKKREQAVGNTRGSAVARMLLKFPAIEDEPCGSKSIHDVKTSTRGLNLSSHEKLDVGKLAKDVQDKVVLVKSNRTADLEMATRMVRRHLYRMAYYKKKP
ncbi:uncharacterized protein LOC110247112 [Exaiptasia diaphana]|uniref:VWFA domain-containing protein n=1 Tax=Exaiptasia diaphana TaxID=2652724 RepID=A0A913XSR3_EXADI|nr:uncharacterized protein LOC110247112 [Exaiptasia diaphana]